MSQQRLSKQQIAQLARQAGWPEDKIPFVVGVAGAESGFKPKALNPNASTGDESYGLMQINMLGAMGPERLKAFGLQSKEQLYDPLTNLKAAKQIYDWQGPGAWSVYRSGKYKEYMPGAAEVAATSQVSQPSIETSQPQPKTQAPEQTAPKYNIKDLMKASLFQNLLNQINQPSPTQQLTQGLLQGFMSGSPLGMFK
jgi:hypothetical protein